MQDQLAALRARRSNLAAGLAWKGQAGADLRLAARVLDMLADVLDRTEENPDQLELFDATGLDHCGED